MTKKISSLQHPLIKHMVKIRSSKKERDSSNQILLAGHKMCCEAPALDVLLIQEGEVTTLSAEEVYNVPQPILKKVTGLEAPEPLAALIQRPPFSSLEGKKWVLCLDQISDPGNLGTLLRSALALGWEGAFLTEDCVDPFNDKALRSAKGASLRLPLRVGTREEVIDFAKKEGLPGLIADLTGTPLGELPPRAGALLVLGNESQGPSPELKKRFPSLTIPINGIESLNVAAAGSILMYNLKQ